jgi:putative hydrolase of the HAD superfamily
MKGIVFDLDETLVDRRGSLDIYARRLNDAFAESATERDDAFVATFHRLDGNGRVPRDEFFERVSSELFRNVTAAQIKAHFEATAWTNPILFDGVRELLRSIRARNWRIGIVTNGGVPAQSAKIANSGLADLIDASVISAAFGMKKPAPEIFRHIVERLQVDPAQSWFIGDDPRADIWGSKQVGFKTCWIERYSAWPDDLERRYDARVAATSDCWEVITRVA